MDWMYNLLADTVSDGWTPAWEDKSECTGVLGSGDTVHR